MQCKFPYFEGRPHIPVELTFNGKTVRDIPLLDTGADFSIFYKREADFLGIDLREAPTVLCENADGSQFEAKEVELSMKIETLYFTNTVYFIESKYTGMAVLGRTRLFNLLKITIIEAD